MIARLLMGLFADLVFESAATGGRTYADELNRYMDRRGFVAPVRLPRKTAAS